jgi:hypothetical protein
VTIFGLTVAWGIYAWQREDKLARLRSHDPRYSLFSSARLRATHSGYHEQTFRGSTGRASATG